LFGEFMRFACRFILDSAFRRFGNALLCIDIPNLAFLRLG